MAQEKLRAVVIGAGALGEHVIDALNHCQLAELVGVADRDGSAAEAAGGELCPTYTDSRQALIEPKPDVVLLALPPRAAAETLQQALRRDLHVWTGAPLARNLPEAVEMCRRTRRADVKLVVGTPRRFIEVYRRARQFAKQLGEIYLVNAQYLFDWGEPLGWRGSMAAGGGATLQLGYHMIDLLVCIAGMPETVYCITGTGQRARRSDDQAIYDTDDTAVAVCRYRGQATATVTVSRCFSPVSEGLTAYCEGGVLSVDAARCVVRDRNGNMLESFQADETPGDLFARMIDDFVAAVETDAARYDASAWESLLTLAAVSAAYLSDQTNQPELPARLLRNYDVTGEDCLKLAPAREPPREAQ